MDPLHIRRQAHRFTLMYKITNNHIVIDPHTYLHIPNNQRTRNTHNQTYQTYYANTDAYKYSYFPRTIRDWNRLPQRIWNSNTIDSFTKQTHMHVSPQHPNTNTQTGFTPPLHTRLPLPTTNQLWICVICTDLGALRINTQNQNVHMSYNFAYKCKLHK